MLKATPALASLFVVETKELTAENCGSAFKRVGWMRIKSRRIYEKKKISVQ
jgi:hypothetical protein